MKCLGRAEKEERLPLYSNSRPHHSLGHITVSHESKSA